MITYDEYVNIHYDICSNWTEEARRIIWQCDELCDMNPNWVVRQLDDNSYIAIYRTALCRLRNRRELNEEQQRCQKEFKRELFNECMQVVSYYCVD